MASPNWATIPDFRLAARVAAQSLEACFDWHKRRRPHQSLNWQTPDETYLGALANAQPKAA